MRRVATDQTKTGRTVFVSDAVFDPICLASSENYDLSAADRTKHTIVHRFAVTVRQSLADTR